MRSDFTVFKRKVPSGKRVVYYYAYDENGVRKGPWTTNCLTITEARNYIYGLIRKGALLPNKTKPVTFGEFAGGFWERGSEYIKNQDGRADITDTYIENCQRMLKNQILPFFANKELKSITPKEVNDWLLGFKNRETVIDGEAKVTAYQNTYANTVFGTLHTMLGYAAEKELIPSNPCAKVKKLKNDRREIQILTPEEVTRLFPKRHKSIWGGKEIAYAANRLASITGMRIGEILGLRGEFVSDKYIYICGQYTDKGYQNHTKTKENRHIPLMPEMMGILRGLMKKNGNGFLFSLDGGAKPVSTTYITREFNRALIRTGISMEEIRRRNLSMHSWRHFVNTDLLRQGLTIQQVQSVTGHKSIRSTGMYSHLDPRLIEDIVKAQTAITTGRKKKAKLDETCEPITPSQKSEKPQSGNKPNLTLVKYTEEKQTRKRNKHGNSHSPDLMQF